MPGFSLWLVPPASSAIHTTLSTLIASALPAQFPADASPPRFVPHVTLTAAIEAAAFSHASAPEPQQKRDAQAWLDGLRLPAAADVRVRFAALDVGEQFVKKLTLRVRNEAEREGEGAGSGLRELARVARLRGVELKGRGKEESRERREVVERWLDEAYLPHCSLVYGSMPISDEKKAQLQAVVEKAGISVDGSGEMGGWEGGSVWLVPTFLPISEWQPWVKRDL
ncbi:2',3'-cyclic-nucleotide 3'-phosphodiesterase [Macrophomina phaseolina]|uniref:2',3'-cyclic-nucleotide 3'-phosphodiesterase n=1 Tax=Macrophomina phaseolina TaxID=35725 RepID=A0ABQ8FUD4_9PEZI|nr:2',3'-cyclic-nucleotide 3'-phosphodiesterase [Macrophomina phaseolina]